MNAHHLTDSEEQLVGDALGDLLLQQHHAIKCAAVAFKRAEEEGGDPVRISAERRILGSLEERRERIAALIEKLDI